MAANFSHILRCEAGKVARYIRSILLCRHHISHSCHLIKTYAVCCCRLFKHYLIYLNLIVLRRQPYSTMPKAKGGHKKKVTRTVVLSTLSDTDDPAPSPTPATSTAPAPAPAPAPALAGEIISSSPMGWRDSHRSLLLLLNLLSRD